MKTIDLRDWQLFRLLYCAGTAVGYMCAYNAFRQAYTAEIYRDYLDRTLTSFGLAGAQYFAFVYPSLIAALLLAGLGIRPRLTLPLALIFTAAVDLALFSRGIYPMTDISFFVLATLCISAFSFEPPGTCFPPGSSRPGSQVPHLALFSIQLALAMILFNAFLNKLALGGISWISGSSIQTYLFTRATFLDRPWLASLSQSEAFAKTLAVGAVIFEGGFLLALVHRRAARIFAITGVCFHILTYVLFAANFMLFYLPVYLAFVDFSRLRRAATGPSPAAKSS